MFVTQTEPSITITVAEATVAELVDADAVGRLVMLNNLDIANTMTYKFQYSLDRVSWTDIAAFTTLAPGGAVQVVLSNPANYHRLRAYGNLKMGMSVTRFKSFTGTFPIISI